MHPTRRNFIKTFAAGTLAPKILGRSVRADVERAPTSVATPLTIQAAYDSLPVRINSPVALSGWSRPALRVPIGEGYKPSMAMLPSGDLIMVGLIRETMPDGSFRERTPVWRSTDSGLTWSQPVIAQDMIGREQWLTCTHNGTLFATSHLLQGDLNNPYPFTHSYLHRSTDGGLTWDRTRVSLGDGYITVVSRNIVELPGKLLFGVSAIQTKLAYLWASTDGGQTWDTSQSVTVPDYGNRPYDNYDGFFSEDFTYLNSSGKLLHFLRCGPPSPMYPMNDGRVTPDDNDTIDRTLRCQSSDTGRTWTSLVDFGDYGLHYPRVLRLSDGRLLMTFTQRSTFYPIGLQAVFSNDDGATWDFGKDHIVIEGKTPWDMPSGGGFGNTIQLENGSLTSCYSYGAQDNKTYIEVAHWSLSPIVEDVVWTDAIGVSVDANSLTKTAASEWGNGGAVATRTVNRNEAVEFSVSDLSYRLCGLSKGNRGHTYTDIDFALYPSADGFIFVYESGAAPVNHFGAYTAADRFRISDDGGIINYWLIRGLTKTLLYTSRVSPTYPLLVNAVLFSSGATITKAVILRPY